MFYHICRRSPSLRVFIESSPWIRRNFCSLASPATNPISNCSEKQSFTLSYLINSCGLSPEKALLASKRLNFKSAEKADSVLAVLKNLGLTKTQISNSIRNCPQILSCDSDKIILPKVEFLSSIGLSSTELAGLLSGSSRILTSSLEKQLIPNFNLFRNLCQSDVEAVKAFKRFPTMLWFNGNIEDNIGILREAGVPDSNIIAFLLRQPRSVFTSAANLRRIVEEVMDMGFNPSKNQFLIAVHAFRAVSKSIWEKKLEVYKKWGLSKDEILVAFKKDPYVMIYSEDKITRLMDFLVNVLGLKPSLIAHNLILNHYSLEKRLRPRFLVYQVLLEKGLIKKNSSKLVFLKLSKERFSDMIIKKYEKEAPELWNIYQKAR